MTSLGLSNQIRHEADQSGLGMANGERQRCQQGKRKEIDTPTFLLDFMLTSLSNVYLIGKTAELGRLLKFYQFN